MHAVRKLSLFDIKSPSDFKILSARKLKRLVQKYKFKLTTGIHTCIGHVLRKYYGVFKRYQDGWQPRKHGMGKWIHISSVAISSGAEFLSTISKFMKRMNFVIACLRPSQNAKLGIFTGSQGSRAVDSKEMYKKAWCMCKVVVFPGHTIAYLTFLSPLHLKPITYDTLWSIKNRIFLGQIELVLLIASQMFFRLISSSFVSCQESRK